MNAFGQKGDSLVIPDAFGVWRMTYTTMLAMTTYLP
jgi:hypothetical protein